MRRSATSAPPEFPKYHVQTYDAPAGHETPHVRAFMNAGMDAPVLDVSGPVDDLRAHVEHHEATWIRITDPLPDLGFLAPCADRIRTLQFATAEVDDCSALSSLTNVRTLIDPPVGGDPFLPSMPRLRTLGLRGGHDYAPLTQCASLRELLLRLVDAADVERLPLLPQLELLGVMSRNPVGLPAFERLPGLRTWITNDPPNVGADTRALLERFGLDADGLAAACAARRERLHAHFAIPDSLRLETDEARVRRAAAALAPSIDRAGTVTASRPACVVLVVDRSRSTAQRFGEDFRLTVDKPGAATSTNFPGPDGSWTVAEGIARAVNAFLRDLPARCAGPDAADVHVALVEYGARVGTAWRGALAGRTFVPARELSGDADWIEPEWAGDSPLGEALELAAGLTAGWAAAHPDSVPPVVIALDGGGSTGDDLGRHAHAIRAVSTSVGMARLYAIQRESSYGFPGFGVRGNHFSERDPLFGVVSAIPEPVERVIREAGYSFAGEPVGCFRDASAADFANLLHLFTALPGLGSPLPLVRHPVPPRPVPAYYTEADSLASAAPPTPAAPWKAPRLKGPMTTALFWRIVDRSRTGAPDPDRQVERIATMLGQLGDDDLLAFQRELDARMAEAYRWDLWAVAFIAKGGCSDDAFDYFRAWLVAQGRAYFEASLANPAHAARRIAPGDEAELESLLSCAATVYEERTGRDDWYDRIPRRTPGEPAGAPWQEAELSTRHPRLARKYA